MLLATIELVLLLLCGMGAPLAAHHTMVEPRTSKFQTKRETVTSFLDLLSE